MLREVLRLYSSGRKGGEGVVVTSVSAHVILPHPLLSGTPGIGKIWFGELLLWTLTRLGIPVVYEQALMNLLFFFDPHVREVFSVSRSSTLVWSRDFAEDLGCVHIFDPSASGSAMEPLWVEQFTIVTASPNRLHFKEFLKRVGKLRFLPHWSLDDLMRILPYVELPGELVEKESLLETRFEVVSGIPRKLFDLDRSLLICQKTILEKLRQNMGNVRSLLSLEIGRA